MGIYKYFIKYWNDYDECVNDCGIIVADGMNEAYDAIKEWFDGIESLVVECLAGTEGNLFSKTDISLNDWDALRRAFNEIYNEARRYEEGLPKVRD